MATNTHSIEQASTLFPKLFHYSSHSSFSRLPSNFKGCILGQWWIVLYCNHSETFCTSFFFLVVGVIFKKTVQKCSYSVIVNPEFSSPYFKDRTTLAWKQKAIYSGYQCDLPNYPTWHFPSTGLLDYSFHYWGP